MFPELVKPSFARANTCFFCSYAVIRRTSMWSIHSQANRMPTSCFDVIKNGWWLSSFAVLKPHFLCSRRLSFCCRLFSFLTISNIRIVISVLRSALSRAICKSMSWASRATRSWAWCWDSCWMCSFELSNCAPWRLILTKWSHSMPVNLHWNNWHWALIKCLPIFNRQSHKKTDIPFYLSFRDVELILEVHLFQLFIHLLLLVVTCELRDLQEGFSSSSSSAIADFVDQLFEPPCGLDMLPLRLPNLWTCVPHTRAVTCCF